MDCFFTGEFFADPATGNPLIAVLSRSLIRQLLLVFLLAELLSGTCSTLRTGYFGLA